MVVVGPAPVAEPAPVDADRARRAYRAAAASGMTRRQAIKAVAAELGVGRREVFDVLIEHEKDNE